MTDDKLSPAVEQEITIAAAEVIRSGGENPTVLEFGRAQRLAGRAERVDHRVYVAELDHANQEIAALRAQVEELEDKERRANADYEREQEKRALLEAWRQTSEGCHSCWEYREMVNALNRAQVETLTRQLNEERACHDCKEFRALVEARELKALRERDEARATKDMHKERQEEEIALRLAAKAREREAREVIQELRRKLACAGVEGSPPPGGEEATIPRLVREKREALAELAYIDSILARRPALDLPTRAENIEKAINVAKQADVALADVERLEKVCEVLTGEVNGNALLAEKAEADLAAMRERHEKLRVVVSAHRQLCTSAKDWLLEAALLAAEPKL